MNERKMDGWRYSEQRDSARKLSPYLVSWDDLKDIDGDPQQWDRDPVKDIPAILQAAGFEIHDLPK